MERSTAILATLLVFQLALIALGLWARGRTRDAADYYLGGRTLGPFVAALAANASSSSAWSLLGVSGFAYLHGLAALWLLPGCIGGFVLNYALVAPRLRDDDSGAITLTELLAGPRGRPGRTAFVWLASLLVLGSLATYVSAQLRAAGLTIEQVFAADYGLDYGTSLLLGAAVVLAYTVLGGYLAASITDTLQGLLMAGVALVLPIAAIAHVGGFGALAEAIASSPVPGWDDPFRGASGFAAAGLALGLLGIGLGYPGQPHAVNKYMGMARGASLRTARIVGIGWAVVLYCGMVLLGLCARTFVVLPAGEHERALYATNDLLLSPVVGGIVVAAVLSAIMSTVDSQLLVCASTVTHDLAGGRADSPARLRVARWTVFAIAGVALAAAWTVDDSLFRHVLFAWSALGSAFGPLLLVHLLRGPVRPWWSFATVAVGGGLAIVTYDAVTLFARGFDERVFAWLCALAIAFCGSDRRARVVGTTASPRR